jgi:hypothetical protein
MMGNLNFKNQAGMNLVSPQNTNRVTQASFNHVNTPVGGGNNNNNLISNLYSLNPNNSKATSVGPSGMNIQ